jgi:hypothetical protein
MTPAVPAWLTQVTESLLDGLDARLDARLDATGTPAWAPRLRRLATRPAGMLPFTVVHDWHSRCVGPLVAEASARRGGEPGRHRAVRSLHERASAGQRVTEVEWCAALEPALTEVYRYAYPYTAAFDTAAAAAGSYALAHGHDEAGAEKYGSSYAELNTTANARVHAAANARANAAALAASFAAADPAAYAQTYPFAHVRACVLAYAGDDGSRERDARARLAEGLADSVERARATDPLN